MARTNTEIYRRYEGELRPSAFRFHPLVASGIRTAMKKKIPLLLLFLPPFIATVVFCFIVYGKYAAADMTQQFGVLRGVAAHFAQRAVINIQVKQQIAEFAHGMRFFCLLVTAWYGAGLLAEAGGSARTCSISRGRSRASTTSSASS